MTVVETTYFGFIAVRNELPSVRDWAPVYHNWIAADKLLYAAAVSHKHDGAVALTDPVGTLVLTSADSGGTLPAGTTYYFTVTYVDANGLETGKSDIVSVTTDASYSAPNTPTINDDATPTDIQTVAGGLSGGSYWYKIALYKDGGESLPSSPVYVAIPYDDTYECTIHFASINSLGITVDGYRVYRKTGNTGSYVKLADITDLDATSFTDDNTDTPVCDKAPVTASTINSFNKITINWAALDYSDAESVKIYVSTATDGAATPSATWVATNMLVSEVDMNDATPVESYIWTGTTLTAGRPPEVSQCYPSPTKINLTGAAEIQGNLPWANLPSNFTWGAPVADDTALNAITGIAGECRIVLDEDAIYVWDADLATPAWVIVTGGSTSFLGVYEYAEDFPTSDVTDGSIAFAKWEDTSKMGWYVWDQTGGFWWNALPNYYMNTIDSISTDMSSDAFSNELKGKLNEVIAALEDAGVIWA